MRLDGYLGDISLSDCREPSSGHIHPLNLPNQTFVDNRLMIDHPFQTVLQAIMKLR